MVSVARDAVVVRSSFSGLGDLGGMMFVGCDYWPLIRSEASSAAGLHLVSVLWRSGDYFDINT